jgi:Rieske Fe-S protein
MPSMSISPARLRRGLLPLAAALALMAAPAWSQTTQAPAEPSFDDATLESFAAAAVEVGEISSEWSQKMQEVEDPARLESMRQDAQDEMVEAVEDEGITVETYNRVLQVAEADPDLGERIRSLMDQQAAP